jgi:hypothetical protein
MAEFGEPVSRAEARGTRPEDDHAHSVNVVEVPVCSLLPKTPTGCHDYGGPP